MELLGRHQLRRQLSHRSHHVDHPGGNRAAWHALIFGFIWRLRKHQAAGLLDRLDAHGAVAAQPRKNNGGAVAMLLRQRAEEDVDLRARAKRHLKRGQVQVFVVHQQAAAGRDHIDVVRLHRHPPGHLLHRHWRAGLEQLGQAAVVFGREVHHHDKRQAGRGGQGGKECLQRAQTAGRSANADHR